ncbi:hypothetical protein [Hankyongella ginsenosidimutans]|uniref:hypothetical protein n=1 Tax=Hankyongella ginsenosidimutans TaxID=1763828 RepID=UPI001CA303B7|nr:hypothetical protein [Hankyongella ginsenosidimutans]
MPTAPADVGAGTALWKWLGVAALVALALIGGWYWRRRRGSALALGVLIGAQLLFGIPAGPAPVAAHGDEDEAAAPSGAGEVAARTADGKLFVPKSVQRIIGVRTVLTVAGMPSRSPA